MYQKSIKKHDVLFFNEQKAVRFGRLLSHEKNQTFWDVQLLENNPLDKTALFHVRPLNTTLLIDYFYIPAFPTVSYSLLNPIIFKRKKTNKP